MTTTSKVLMLMMSALALFAGCTSSDEPTSGHTAGLAACPPDIDEGWPCDISEELACLRGEDPASGADGDGDVCRCERFADDTDAGLVVCDSEPPPGGSYCPEHAHTGDVCDPSASDECSHSCDPDVVCRCVPTADTPDCGHIWLCEGGGGGEPPPGTEEPFCDDAALHVCLEAGFAECISEDGRWCVCEVGPAGEMALRCDGDDGSIGGGDPGDPGGTDTGDGTDPGGAERCTDEHVLSCEAGRDAFCIRDDGCECHCDFTADGIGGLICDD